jgi:hypothetical protein
MNWSCNQIPMAIPKKLKISSPKTLEFDLNLLKFKNLLTLKKYHFQIKHMNTMKSPSNEHEIPHMP